MKRKFIILTLCFTLIFSSINFKKSYADGGIISLPMLAVVSTLAVGTGIALKNIDDIYDVGRLFYDYVQSNNSITWDVIESTFLSSVSVLQNGLVSVDSSFLDIVKDFFNSITGYNDKFDVSNINYSGGLPIVDGRTTTDFAKFFDYLPHLPRNIIEGFEIVGNTISVGSFAFNVTSFSFPYSHYDIYYNNVKIGSHYVSIPSSNYITFGFGIMNDRIQMFYSEKASNHTYVYQNPLSSSGSILSLIGSVSLPYQPGSFDWDNNVDDKLTPTGDLPLPIPGDLSGLIGKNPSDIWSNTDDLVGNGDLSIPDVNDPSISLDGTVSFPNTGVENPPVDIPGVENPPIGGLPSFPSFGDSLDFSPMYLTNINEKFPFSLPWDIGRLINKFDIEPKAPIFKVPIVTSEIELDLTIFDEWANIGRFFVLIGFALSLILISTKLLG